MRTRAPESRKDEAGGVVLPRLAWADPELRRLRWELVGAVVALLVLFGWSLVPIFRAALGSELYSHIPLMPVIVGYLIWVDRDKVPAPTGRSHLGGGLCLLVSVASMSVYFVFGHSPIFADPEDRMIPQMLSVVAFVWAAAFWIGGTGVVRAIWFPLAMLGFAIPFPSVVVEGMVVFFQHTSAEAAYWMLKASGMSVFRQGLVMGLPGINILVAPECSGMRSSVVLLLTSMIAGYLFLGRTSNRLLLAAMIIPIAILRNGFRIFTISMLCVHIDPSMINGVIHKRGGPVFFVMSLVPLFLMMNWLRKREARAASLRSAGEQR